MHNRRPHAADSAQEAWLEAQLATHTNMCTIAYFHPLAVRVGDRRTVGLVLIVAPASRGQFLREYQPERAYSERGRKLKLGAVDVFTQEMVCQAPLLSTGPPTSCTLTDEPFHWQSALPDWTTSTL
jgi:hypothetical protein